MAGVVSSHPIIISDDSSSSSNGEGTSKIKHESSSMEKKRKKENENDDALDSKKIHSNTTNDQKNDDANDDDDEGDDDDEVGVTPPLAQPPPVSGFDTWDQTPLYRHHDRPSRLLQPPTPPVAQPALHLSHSPCFVEDSQPPPLSPGTRIVTPPASATGAQEESKMSPIDSTTLHETRVLIRTLEKLVQRGRQVHCAPSTWTLLKHYSSVQNKTLPLTFPSLLS